MEIVASAVILVYLAVSAWALRARRGNLAAEDFLHVWRFSPWGKQFMVDFYCLEIVLGLWMVPHALANDSVLLAIVCLATMPILGALPPAAYLLLAG
jgi:heme A synthase